MTSSEPIYTFDRALFPDEGDRLDFWAAGFRGALRRSHLGFWCGYVGIPRLHPYYGMKIGELNKNNLTIHGGISYASHILDGGFFERTFKWRWWIGFDCGHSWDVIPAMPGMSMPDAVYRTEKYAFHQVCSLAAQLYEKQHMEAVQ